MKEVIMKLLLVGFFIGLTAVFLFDSSSGLKTESFKTKDGVQTKMLNANTKMN